MQFTDAPPAIHRFVHWLFEFHQPTNGIARCRLRQRGAAPVRHARCECEQARRCRRFAGSAAAGLQRAYRGSAGKALRIRAGKFKCHIAPARLPGQRNSLANCCEPVAFRCHAVARDRHLHRSTFANLCRGFPRICPISSPRCRSSSGSGRRRTRVSAPSSSRSRTNSRSRRSRRTSREHKLDVVLINSPPGDWAEGDRGLASIPGREHEFTAGIATALRYAEALHCPRLHVMAGLLPEGADADERERRLRVFVRNLRFACSEAAGQGVTILIEPLNPRDVPNYLFSTQADAHAIRTKSARRTSRCRWISITRRSSRATCRRS